jgi:hypothetical protein
MRKFVLVLVALAAGPALAESPPASTGNASAPANPDCVAAGATYVPGVAADGSAVAPADLPQSPSPVADKGAPVEIDSHLAGQYGVPAPGGAYGGKAIIGYVTLKDGRAYLNGQPLAADAQAALAAACNGKH